MLEINAQSPAPGIIILREGILPYTAGPHNGDDDLSALS